MTETNELASLPKNPASINTGVKGEIAYQVFEGVCACTPEADAATPVLETDFNKNLITNFGLDCYFQGTASTNTHSLGIGRSNTTPSFTDTLLGEYVAKAIVTWGSVKLEADGSVSTLGTINFALGALVGNFCEFGLMTYGATNTTFSRALIKDTSGNPITLTLTADQSLRVFYKLSVKPILVAVPTYTVNSTIDGSNVLQTVTCTAYPLTTSADPRIMNLGDTNPGRARMGGVSGGTNATSITKPVAYVPGTFQQNFKAVFGINDGNSTTYPNTIFIGITTNSAGTTNSVSFELSPGFTKNNLKIAELTYSVVLTRA